MRVFVFYYVKRRFGIPVWMHVAIALPNESGDGYDLFDLITRRG